MSAVIPQTVSAPRLRIVATGATGLVGGALVPALRAAGHRVDRVSCRPPARCHLTYDDPGLAVRITDERVDWIIGLRPGTAKERWSLHVGLFGR
jgi:NAD dependent epimerase/dehydratase family enzyme